MVNIRFSVFLLFYIYNFSISVLEISFGSYLNYTYTANMYKINSVVYRFTKRVWTSWKVPVRQNSPLVFDSYPLSSDISDRFLPMNRKQDEETNQYVGTLLMSCVVAEGKREERIARACSHETQQGASGTFFYPEQ